MNVWIIDHHADPPDGLGTRTFDLARTVAARGDRFTIVASNFSHYRFANMRKRRPLSLWQSENIEGVTWIWIHTPPYRGNDWRRLLNQATYCVLTFVACVGRRPSPDVVVGVSVHPFAAFTGWLLARMRGAAFVFQVTDLWPETLVEFGRLRRDGRAARALYRLEAFLFRRSAKIIMLWRDTREYVKSSAGVEDRVVWIPHTVDLSRQMAPGLAAAPTSGKFVVMFAGAFVQSNCVDLMLAAAECLQRRGRRDILLKLVGEGTLRKQLIDQAKDARLENVEFPGSVPKREVGALLRSADALIYGLRDVPLYRFGISLNKLADYLASARPILFFGRSSYDPVAEAAAGISVPTDDPERIADTIERLAATSPEEREAMGRRGRQFLEEHHGLELLSDRFARTLHEAAGEPPASLRVETPKRPWYYEPAKRACDIAISFLAGLLSAPVAIVAAAAIKLESPGPVIYRSTRVGRHGVPFQMWKFRTMVSNADRIGGSSTADDDPRITRLGRLLRTYKIDEIPQLVNVLRGEMSLVGPRPQVQHDVDLYTEEERLLLSVAPGITDFASIRFRNEGEILKGSADPDRAYIELIRPEKIRLGLEYVRTRSLATDARIMLETARSIVKRGGTSN